MNRIVLFTIVFYISFPTFSQNGKEKFTLDDVIRISKEQSLAAIIARNRFLAGYWQYKSYKASRLPSLVFNSTLPDLNRSIGRSSYVDSSGSIQYVYGESSSITNTANISLNQNIGLTGGSFSVYSELQRIDQPGEKISGQFISKPISLSINQPLFSFNSMKWDKKIQPLLYIEAQKKYLKDLEEISLQAISNFFDLVLAKLNLSIAQINYTNSDTLYKIAVGRYNIGSIAQNDVLQMELSLLNARADLNLAKITLEMQKYKLWSFLGYTKKMDFDLVLPDSLPSLELNYEEVFDLAMKNNPDVIAMERQMIEARMNVAQAKGEQRGKTVSLTASYGQTQQAEYFPSAYRDPSNQQQILLSITFPIIDWGLGKGKVKMAESNQEVINSQVQQTKIDFEQNIFLQVMQFNLQYDQVKTALKADTVAQKRYDVTKQRFIIGKIAILDLNVAQSDKDQAKRSYVSALRNYWYYFYTLRQLTLYDFVNKQSLSKNYDELIN